MVKVQTFDRHQVWRFNKTRKLMSIQFGELARDYQRYFHSVLKDNIGGDLSVA